jgi:hypothetical protein
MVIFFVYTEEAWVVRVVAACVMDLRTLIRGRDVHFSSTNAKAALTWRHSSTPQYVLIVWSAKFIVYNKSSYVTESSASFIRKKSLLMMFCEIPVYCENHV